MSDLIAFLREVLASLKESGAPPYMVIGVISFCGIAWVMWRIGLASKQGVAAIREQYKDNLAELERRHERITDERDGCEKRLHERDIKIEQLQTELNRVRQELWATKAAEWGTHVDPDD